jgi:hypothetical protein
MINMISLNTFDALDNPNPPQDDPPDTGLATDLFASFLIAPVSFPPMNLPVPDPREFTPPETGVTINSVELQTFLPKVSETRDFTVIPETNVAVTDSLIGSGDENKLLADFSLPALPESQPARFVVAGFDTQKAETESVALLGPPVIPNTAGDGAPNVPSNIFISQTLPMPSDNNPSPVVGALPVPIRRDTNPKISFSEVSNPKSIVGAVETVSPVETVPAFSDVTGSNSAIRRPDFSPYQQTAEPPVPNQTTEASIPPRKEMTIEPPAVVDINTKIFNTAPKPLTGPFQAVLPSVVRNVSSILRDINSLKTNTLPDKPSERGNVDLISQNPAGEGSQTSDSPTTEVPSPEKELKAPDHVAEAVFNASLNEAFKSLNVSHRPVETIARASVIEQVELRIPELASVVQNIGEKKVLKIRLTPPELGAVEITLQKSATGKIDAHFQAETHETRQILTEGLVQLRESLERSGMHVGDLDTSFGSFSSPGNETRRDQSQKFETAELPPAGTTSFDGILKNEDEAEKRLVNLRA